MSWSLYTKGRISAVIEAVKLSKLQNTDNEQGNHAKNLILSQVQNIKEYEELYQNSTQLEGFIKVKCVEIQAFGHSDTTNGSSNFSIKVDISEMLIPAV